MVVFEVDWVMVLQFILGALLPAVVGLVTTKVTAAGKKAVLLLTLSLVTSILTQLADALASGQLFNLGGALVLGLGTYILAVAVHFGLMNPTGLKDKVQAALVTPDGTHAQ